MGADAAAIAELEAHLGVVLALGHRERLLVDDGWQGWWGDVFVMFYGVADLRDVNLELDLDGFVAFGSDGGRELIGYDTRVSPPAIVMIDITGEGWDAAIPQAASFDEFIAQRAAGEPLRFNAD